MPLSFVRFRFGRFAHFVWRDAKSRLRNARTNFTEKAALNPIPIASSCFPGTPAAWVHKEIGDSRTCGVLRVRRSEPRNNARPRVSRSAADPVSKRTSKTGSPSHGREQLSDANPWHVFDENNNGRQDKAHVLMEYSSRFHLWNSPNDQFQLLVWNGSALKTEASGLSKS